MAQHSPNQEGWIYFVKAEGAPIIKIGFTTNMAQRMGALQAHSPLKLKVLKQVKSQFKIEQVLLHLFSETRLHGEWFRESKDLLAFIDLLDDKAPFLFSKFLLAK